MGKQDDEKTIEILDSLIGRYRSKQLEGVLTDCNSFGSPALNFLYKEVYNSCIKSQPILNTSWCGDISGRTY